MIKIFRLFVVTLIIFSFTSVFVPVSARQVSKTLSTPILISLTPEQYRDMGQIKPVTVFGFDKYVVRFTVTPGPNFEGLPTSLQDATTEFGKVLNDIVVPVLPKFSSNISLAIFIEETNGNTGFAIPAIYIENDTTSVGSGSVITFDDEGSLINGYKIVGDKDLVNFGILDIDTRNYLENQNLVPNVGDVALGNILLMKFDQNNVPVSLFTTGSPISLENAKLPKTDLVTMARFGETDNSGHTLSVTNISVNQIPAEVQTQLKNKWVIRVGINHETGWIADYSKAYSFFSLLNQRASLVGLRVDSLVTKPESVYVVKNLAAFLTLKMVSTEYMTQAPLKAVGPTGAIIQMPKFTLENAPIVVVEYRDKKELGAIGKNKDVAYEATKFGSTLVRYYTPAKDNTPGYITIKLYEDVNMLSEHATLKALLGHASGTTWGVCFGYLGSDVMSGFMNFSLLQIMSVKLPDDTYATLADFNLVKK